VDQLLVITLTIYSRPGCHLCDDMKKIVEEVVGSSGTDVAVNEIDITTDPELEAAYGLEIPVLMIDGKKAAKYRVTDEQLTRLLAARQG
jgi:glutaredoxin